VGHRPARPRPYPCGPGAGRAPEAWAQVPPELREAARMVGGLIGAADLLE